MMVWPTAAESGAGRPEKDGHAEGGNWQSLEEADQLGRLRTLDLAGLRSGLLSGSLVQDVVGSIDGLAEACGRFGSACETAVAGLRVRRVRRTWWREDSDMQETSRNTCVYEILKAYMYRYERERVFP